MEMILLELSLANLLVSCFGNPQDSMLLGIRQVVQRGGI